ncbi:GIN domain-containing protein [Caulobacter sp. LjRoot300]|uniref:GIN domain-containing protein n=1 Tax=Caulobacter sp. LjRoot300 TaxID=3342321 RepID=UPI003ECF6467
MRALLLLASAAAALGFAGTAAADPSVKIKDAVARVVVVPEARGDVKVEFLTTNKSLPLDIRKNGSEVTVDGRLRRNRINGCNTVMGKTVVHVRGIGDVKWEDIPQIVVRVPMDAEVGAAGAVFGSVGRTDHLELSNAGCGDWTVANVRGKLELSQAGSGDTKTGSAGSAEINIAGSGDVKTQEIGGDLEVNIAGSGGVTAASVNGKLEANIAGSGDVTVNGGRSRSVEVSIMGSGNVDFGGEADTAEVSVAGSGDVSIAKVNGPVHKSVAGSGEVNIGR